MSEDTRRTGVHGFSDLHRHPLTRQYGSSSDDDDNQMSFSTPPGGWLHALLGPHAMGVRMWFSLALMMLSIIILLLAINPLTLSIGVLVGLGVVGAIGSIALMGVLINGIRAFNAKYEEDKNRPHADQNYSRLQYLRDTARQFFGNQPWGSWIASCFGPDTTGVLNWLLIAAIALLIIVSLNPLTLPAAAFLSLLIPLAIIGGMAVIGALVNGTRALMADYHEYKTTSRVLDPSPLMYLRHLVGRFPMWAITNPAKLSQLIMIVIILLGPVFAIPSLIGASALTIFHTVGLTVGLAVVYDAICRFSNYVVERFDNFTADPMKASSGRTLGTKEYERGSQYHPVVTQSPSLAGSTRLTPMQMFSQELSTIGITYEQKQAIFTFPCDQIECFVVTQQGRNQYVIPIPKSGGSLPENCKQAFTSSGNDIRIIVMGQPEGNNNFFSGLFRSNDTDTPETKVRNYLGNAITPDRKLNVENIVIPDQQHIQFDFSQDAVSYEAVMPASTTKLQIV